VIYLVAKTRRQAIAWCQQEGEDPGQIRQVEVLSDVKDFDPETDTAVYLGMNRGVDATERREILTTLGVKG
jgi:hypothetical protein